ncbi:hypothetical protein [Sulfitobacter donghicola]|uniref:Uncharacterized protein n=1 Tax=Sulfitobacter donghicola DSW-25 = KCTC 12864 = JCM 14565 TaxID=1300350 RepID=A0A073IET9_9RHOB|nr:hypothetical protein [Sulfitobacter donghicola]KEJ88883.1 hypothetical protein DSW25_13840 [Sulfitobacter donghicola DSW-25 = KCTC 12864 = JCM 14565]
MRHTPLHRFVLALITLALLSVPFAHKVTAAPISAEMAQFLAIGGQLSDLCGDPQGQASSTCASCTIAATMLSPKAIKVLRPSLAPALSNKALMHIALLQGHAIRNPHPARAPPKS